MDLRVRALALAEANVRHDAAAKTERQAETLRLSVATLRDFCRQFALPEPPDNVALRWYGDVTFCGEPYGYVALEVVCPKDRHEIELGRVRGQWIPQSQWDDDKEQARRGFYRWDEDEVLLTLASFWSGQAPSHCRECHAEQTPPSSTPGAEPSRAKQLEGVIRSVVREEVGS